MDLKTFNLVKDPWITALLLDGTTKELSLKELFEQAHEVLSVSGINNINTVSINHFLSLLVLRVTGGFETVKEFKELLDSKWTDDIIAYLNKNIHLFSLYDDQYPFLQNANLREHVQAEKVTDCTWFSIRSLGLKEIPFVTNNTILNPPNFEGKEIAQFLLTEAFFAGGGGCHTFDAAKLKEAGFDPKAAKAKVSPRLNKRTVAVIDSSFAKTLLLNTPNIKADSSYRAPWERQQSVFPEEVSVDTTLDIMSYRPKNVLLKWKNNKVVGVFSAQSVINAAEPKVNKNHLPFALISNATDRFEERYTQAEVSNVPWDDFETIFITNTDIDVAGKRSPVILKWWASLQEANLLSESITFSTITTICKDVFGNINLEIRVRNQTIPSTILNTSTRQGSSLLTLFQFISDINRKCFTVSTANSVARMKPVLLLRGGEKILELLPKKRNAPIMKIKRTSPCSSQFLTYCKIIFEEALEQSIDASKASKKEWQERIREYKKRIIEAAETVWSAAVLSVPMSTLTTCRAVGKSNQKLSKILHHYRKETKIENQ